jgi:L,D-peptidoglycan transpeptidase YkuD (ErfK/YbiS/YcfS/YnhG family)
MPCSSLVFRARRLPHHPDKNVFQGYCHSSFGLFPFLGGQKGLTVLKREGDKKTPHALLHPLYGLYRPDRVARPRSALPFYPLHKQDGWCDDPRSGAYNRPVQRPFPYGHEVLWRDDDAYDRLIVLDWNRGMTRAHPARQRWQGSAIFLHQIARGKFYTEGCLALAPDHMQKLCTILGQDTLITIQP